MNDKVKITKEKYLDLVMIYDKWMKLYEDGVEKWPNYYTAIDNCKKCS